MFPIPQNCHLKEPCVLNSLYGPPILPENQNAAIA